MADSITYSEGLEVGNCFFYHEDGYLEAVGPMRLGLCHGYWKEYYPDGIVKQEGNYLNDEKQGIWKLYWASGELCQLLTYENGALMEVSEFTTPKGKKMDKGTLSKGNGTRLVYSIKGKLLTETNYENGLAEGKAASFNEKGKKQAEGKFIKGKKDGVWFFYDEKGKLHTEGNYKNGKPLGIWKYFNTEGKEVGRQTIRE
jgi:antitoxin component YwqK of YwqJK toxin-antitoxin module